MQKQSCFYCAKVLKISNTTKRMYKMLLFLLAYLAVRKRIARLVEGFIDIVSELLACLAQLFQELFAVLLGFARNSSNGFRFAFHKVFHTVANVAEPFFYLFFRCFLLVRCSVCCVNIVVFRCISFCLLLFISSLLVLFCF